MVAERPPADHREMSRLTASLPTKAAKIRALDAAGYTRSQIAAFLGIRYQHVRNVLKSPGGATAEPTQDAPPYGGGVVEADGRIRLPEPVMQAMRLEPNVTYGWRFEDGDFIIMGRKSGVEFAQHLVRSKLGERSMVDEFLEERRAEARREDRFD
jgi:hypothetical protein